jgi:hypothetical protein
MSPVLNRFYGRPVANAAREAIAARRVSKYRRGPRWFAGAGDDAAAIYMVTRSRPAGCSSTLRKTAKIIRIGGRI